MWLPPLISDPVELDVLLCAKSQGYPKYVLKPRLRMPGHVDRAIQPPNANAGVEDSLERRRRIRSIPAPEIVEKGK